MRTAMYELIAYVFYPAWLLAGALDYWCHRRSAIERTSSVTESWHHLAQLGTIAVIVLGISFLAGSMSVFAIVAAAGIAHTVLSYLDVRFTERRRYISPIEQHVHAVLDIVPLVAIAVWIVLEWSNAAGDLHIRLRDPMLETWQTVAILVSVFVVAAGPVLEEVWRTSRVAARMRDSRDSDDQAGFATIK